MNKTKFLLSTILLSTTVSSLALAGSVLERVTVTATREAKPLSQASESVSIIDNKEIEDIAPAHPAELMNRSAGVHVNNLGGEGHMTSIRQPITTGGVYLFLEDGIPTRPTGLFNHNGLYEVNIQQADRVEITKGPGSALYGSDSIGGVINSITAPAPDKMEAMLNPEYGSYGWKRLLTSFGAPISDDTGFRINVNLTGNDGYRDDSQYSRYAATGRLDGFLTDNTSYKTLLSYSEIDQAGTSSLEANDYLNAPQTNFFQGDAGRREIQAFRASTEFAYEPDSDNLTTITPFFRDNRMKLMPSWMLNYDANDRDYQFQSYGMLAKYRRKMPDQTSEIIAGIDIDYTPSTYKEIRLSPVRNGSYITGTTPTGRTNYDFDADQLSVSPYLHGEWQALDKLRFNAGLRYDYFHVDYADNLDSSVEQSASTATERFTHLRPDSQDLSYDSFSPKFGAVYNVDEDMDIFASYRHSFRVPSIGQLFRSGSTQNTDDLDPVKTDSFEIGLRGSAWDWLNYEASIYHMITRDDIVNVIDNTTLSRRNVNAGETTHQGIEIGLNGDLTDEWSFSTGWSFTNQEYEDYSAIEGFGPFQSTVNYSGNDVPRAPETLGNLSITYQPKALKGSRFELEWEHFGSYFTDQTNAQDYDGHNLFNLRASKELNERVELYGRVMNITNRRYSTYTSSQVGSDAIQYRPGNPRTFFVGLRAKF